MKKLDVKKTVEGYTYTTTKETHTHGDVHVAACAEHPYLSDDGPTPEAAIVKLKKVVTFTVEWMIEDGNPVPEVTS